MAMNNKMKSAIVLSSLTAAILSFSGCGDASSPSGSTGGGSTGNCDSSITALPSVISSDMTLDNTKIYGLDGKVNVKSGATLTVLAGTTVAGCTESSYMVVEPGAELIAVGTQAEPIVFTSQKDALGLSQDNVAGEWGGLVLAGLAFTHYSDNKYEADESVSFGSSDHSHDSDSSGDLEYVVIKHSGNEVEKDKELNGLSLAGVGSSTTLENIAIIGGLDDGLEIWGGTVNITGLYVYNAADDSVDTDLGYRGKIMNVLVQQVNVDKDNNHDSAAMEFGNDHDTITTDDGSATQPEIENFTAYVKGGGFYNKYDAGFKWNNIKFISEKTSDVAMIHFRGTDAYDTGAKHVDGDVCFKNTTLVLTEDSVYSKANSKDPKATKTAFDYFAAATKQYAGTGTIMIDDDSCTGADVANIWKGKAGSNDPLETP